MKKAALCLLVTLIPASAIPQECLPDRDEDRRLELYEIAQRMVTCLSFYTREREVELDLMDRVLTFTNVRSILAIE